MKIHTLSLADLEKAKDEIADRDHLLVSADAMAGGRKKIYFNPGTRIYRIKTDKTEATFRHPPDAVIHYNER